jgi:phosphatidylinositol-3-phosphatase
MRTRLVIVSVVLAVTALWTPAVADAQTQYDHVVVVMFENTDRTAAMGQPNFAAFANASSSDTGVNSSPVSSGYHEFGAYPSLPNYLMFVSGGSQGCTTDTCLTNGQAHAAITPAYPAPTIFSQLGIDSQTLSELEPAACYLANSGKSPNQYIVHHNPEAYFTSSTPFCTTNNKLYPATGALDLTPKFTLIVPSKCHQGHTPCTVTDANTWLGQELPRIRAALTGHWALVVTFDESSTGGTKTAVYFAVQTSDAVQVQQPASATENDALATIDSELGLPVLGAGNPTLLAPFFGGLPTPAASPVGRPGAARLVPS